VKAACVALLFGLLAAGTAAAAPIDVIRGCAESAPAGLQGIDKLSSVCPELESALVSLGLDRILYEGWREHLGVLQLRDIAALVPQFQAQKRPVGPDTGSLAGILSALNHRDGSAPKGWWDSFKEWWQNWLARSDSAVAKWLRQLSERIDVSPKLVRVIAYAVAAAVLAMMVWMAILEWRNLRAARSRLARGCAHDRIGEVAAQLVSPPQPTSAEERLSVLLRDLVARLLETGRLQAERSLTHRELVARSRFDEETQSGAFAAVSRVAEALLYGPRGAVQSEVPPAVASAEALLAQLRTATP
jgi:hypothetical protein